MTMADYELSQHKKRFGQYFSGDKVANMLFSLLPVERRWRTVVDPMAGRGDMLIAVAKHQQYEKLFGIEIDADVAQQCAYRLPSAKIKYGDAFTSEELITDEGWDLVITNPPYVRYQLLGNSDSVMPTGQVIRTNLAKQIKMIQYLSDAERSLFLSLARNYSGLADMAVPAWILCAALVKKGGYLAIVVPDTWLNRDYACPIQYLLSKCFSVETIAKDTNAKWFPDALVKTSLVVAKRQGMSPISNLIDAETQIIEIDRKYTQRTLSLFPHMLNNRNAQKWALEEDLNVACGKNELPHELAKIVGDDYKEYISLSNLGINYGQGLRTGANDFFYLSLKGDSGDYYFAHSNVWDKGGREYKIRKSNLIRALQNRGEIDGLIVTEDKLSRGVLYLTEKADKYLQEYIISAEQHKDSRGRSFREFSAVYPNEKRIGNQIVRYWYMLPRFARRHLPDLCLTRISSKIPECLYVEQTPNMPIAIDANMVTLWSDNEETRLVAFAILNSTWTKLFLELICTVMGGGALKIEAGHLKNLLLPKMTNAQIQKLKSIASRIISEGKLTQDTQDAIDSVVFAPLRDEMAVEKARILLNQKVNERGTRI